MLLNKKQQLDYKFPEVLPELVFGVMLFHFAAIVDFLKARSRKNGKWQCQAQTVCGLELTGQRLANI